MSSTPAPTIPGFRAVPFTGVIYVMTEAGRRGYRYGDPAWCNLGQGQPEAGKLPGGASRVETLSVSTQDQEYAPINGIPELRAAIAKSYNDRYRRGAASQYTADNVCVCGGGRLSLTRTVAALGSINLGHFLPDYTAYEELLDIFRSFTAIPILLEPADQYRFSSEQLRHEITGRGLSAVLLSNPANPTGQVLQGDVLARWVEVARELGSTLLIDEFYSHYVWPLAAGIDSRPDEAETISAETISAETISAARYVQDVDRDPIVIFDGLTKGWRYPGWRCTWVLGPRAVIDAVSSTGSFLDGGGSRPLQRAAIPLLAPDAIRQEVTAIRDTFLPKRRLLVDGLRAAGIHVPVDPSGTFYVWADVSTLPAPLNDGTAFFQRALDEKIICVPGEFFDINPGKRRASRVSRFQGYVRFSFGAEYDVLERGIHRMQRMIANCSG